MERVGLAELTIEDESSFRHVSLVADLTRTLELSGARFLVPPRGEIAPWDRALLLNLLFWEPGLCDVLPSRDLPADVVAHVAWHQLADSRVATSVEAHLLAESIASAFDLYLVGRTLGHSPDSSFLATQVPRMAEAAEGAGMDEQAFEKWLSGVAAEPEMAFEKMRELLFDASLALIPAMPPERAAEILTAFDEHPMSALLHHYELPTWVLRARIESLSASGDGGRAAREVDAQLRGEPDALGWLETHWVRPLLQETSR